MNENIDMIALGNLIKKARGTISNTEFASYVGVSPSYISRLVNAKQANIPSVELLTNIAAIAQNGVTLNDLLLAAKYPAAKVPSSISMERDFRFIQATILTALQSLKIAWSKESIVNSQFNLSISFRTGELKNWHFLFLNYVNNEVQSNQLKAHYIDLVFASLTPHDKISFVTSNLEEYKLYHEKLPENLNLNLSIILIDKKNLTIKKEEWLHTTQKLSKEALTSYLLS